MYCPIMSYHQSPDGFPKKSCMGEWCALYGDKTNGCLIRTFLITQIEKSNIVVPSCKKETNNEIERIVPPRSSY